MTPASTRDLTPAATAAFAAMAPPRTAGHNAPGAGAARPRRSRGFTLIEVLVALGIVAIALTAGLQATAGLTHNARRQTDMLLAHLCAENELAKVRLSKQMPGVGDSTVACEQAGVSYTVAISVLPTPNPSFRRVDAQVFDGNAPVLKLSTVVGRF